MGELATGAVRIIRITQLEHLWVADFQEMVLEKLCAQNASTEASIVLDHARKEHAHPR